MCKCLKRLTVALIFILCLTLADAVVYGAGDEVIDTEVSYQPSEPVGWPDLELELSVQGGGYVLDGDARIEDGIMIYTMREGEQKKFQFVARAGYRLQSLTQNEVSVLASLNEENELTVTMPAEKQKIEAVFTLQQHKPVIPDENPKPENPKQEVANPGIPSPEGVKTRDTGTEGINANGVKTGDQQNNLHWANLMILSVLLILWCMLERRKQKKTITVSFIHGDI